MSRFQPIARNFGFQFRLWRALLYLDTDHIAHLNSFVNAYIWNAWIGVRSFQNPSFCIKDISFDYIVHASSSQPVDDSTYTILHSSKLVS